MKTHKGSQKQHYIQQLTQMTRQMPQVHKSFIILAADQRSDDRIGLKRTGTSDYKPAQQSHKDNN